MLGDVSSDENSSQSTDNDNRWERNMQVVSDTVDSIVCSEGEEEESSNDDL